MDAPSTLSAPETHTTDAMQVDLRPKTAADKGKQKSYESVDFCDKDEEDDEEEEEEEEDENEADYDGIGTTDDDDDSDDDADNDAMLAELLRLGNNIAESEQSLLDLANARAAFEAGKRIGFASQALVAVARAKGWAWVRLALLPTTLGRGSSLGMSEVPHPACPIRVKCGEHDEDGNLDGTGLVLLRQGGWAWGHWERGLHGEGTLVDPDGSRYVGSWCHGSQHGKGVLTDPDGTLYDGNWAEGLRHGQGVTISLRGRQRTSAQWKAGKITGEVTTTVCACFDLSPDPVKQLQHHAQSPALCHPFGFLARESCNTSLCLWSNGDTMCTERGKKDDDPAGWPCFRMSPECPDERFRGKVIAGVPWLYPCVTRADGSLTYVLGHPDPAAAPEAFCLYHDYYTLGHLPVEDRDRDDISALLNRAAQRLPAPFLSGPSASASSSSSSALAFSSF